MSQANQDLDHTSKLAGLVGQIGCVTGFASIVVIGAAYAAGSFLDGVLDTEWIFTILFLVGSFPITLYIIVRISLYALRRIQTPDSKAVVDSSEEESTTEEEIVI